MTAQASGNAQLPQFATPTPQPDGRIIYVVQEGDTCIRISLLSGIPVDQLRTLNRLDESCLLTPGQQLLLGIGGPSGGSPTPGPAATPTVGQPTPTPLPGEGNICLALYDDVNGDALRQDTEVLVPDGALSITGSSGQFSKTSVTTAGPDPVCFQGVPEGTYNISIAPPAGYNPTTQLNYTIEVKAGDQIFVDFGAQKGGASQPEEPGTAGNGNSSGLLGILGIVLLLAGGGLGVYAWRFYGRRPPYNNLRQ
jgi:hypothetical protein